MKKTSKSSALDHDKMKGMAEDKQRVLLMQPLSDAGKDLLQGTNWEHWIGKTTLADKSEDSDTIRERLASAESARKVTNTTENQFVNDNLRFMQQAERFKAQTVALHFKIEELRDRFDTLVKFRIIQDSQERSVYLDRFTEAAELLEKIRSLQDKFDKLNFTPFVNTQKKEDLVRIIKRQHRKIHEALAETEETFVQMEESMLKLVSHQQRFHQKLQAQDELAMSWIMKRPTEVVGLEAKKAAIKAQAAKEKALKESEQARRAEIERAQKMRLAQLKIIRENEYLGKYANNSDALLKCYTSATLEPINSQNFIEDKILRRKQRSRLRSLNQKTQEQAELLKSSNATQSLPQLLQLGHNGQLLNYRPTKKHYYLSQINKELLNTTQPGRRNSATRQRTPSEVSGKSSRGQAKKGGSQLSGSPYQGTRKLKAQKKAPGLLPERVSTTAPSMVPRPKNARKPPLQHKRSQNLPVIY